MSMEWFLGYHQGKLEEARIKRQQAAQQIRRIRTIERTDPSYAKEMDLEELFHQAPNLPQVLDYIRKNSLLKTVLEIGTGTGETLLKLAKSQLGENLTFIGTALTLHPQMTEKTPNVQIHLTSAERLRDIQPESIGGVFSTKALAFSTYPELAVENIDRVLSKGGLVVATFRKIDGTYGKYWDELYDQWRFQPHTLFSRELKKRGYNIAIRERENGDDILVAVKPDKKNRTKAQELLGV